MYKRYGMLLLFWNLVFFMSFFSIKMLERNRLAAQPAFHIQFQKETAEEESSQIGQMTQAASGQRVIDYQVLERKWAYEMTEEEYQVLCRIVEAEAGGEDITGKMLVANVVLNRVDSPSFPDTVQRVVFQKDKGTYQFSPIRDGRYKRVTVSEETREAVDKALLGEDISKGALYFACRKAANPDKMKWFDQNLEFLFTYGGHEFFA